MNDFLGKELTVGDHVVVVERGYCCFLKGVIRKISDKLITVDPLHPREYSPKIQRYPGELIKIDKE